MSADAELTPAARVSAGIDDALMVVSEAVAGNETAEQALDVLVNQLNKHSQLTWRFSRWWWYVQTNQSISATDSEVNQRWSQVMNAFKAAIEK